MGVKRYVKKARQTVKGAYDTVGKRALTAVATLGGSEYDKLLGSRGKNLYDKTKEALTGSEARKEEHAKQAAEEQRLAEIKKTADQVREEATKRYLTGELGEGTKGAINREAEISDAKARQALGMYGIGDSSTAVDLERGVEAKRVSDLDTALDAEYQTIMKAVGLEGEALEVIGAMNRADMKAATETYAGVMTAIGNLTYQVADMWND